uniref:Uncharacterized protein n=1 Tax=Rhizophora mucronata TaxID=61149 RepID=A0A2P2NTD1_RHIMU
MRLQKQLSLQKRYPQLSSRSHASEEHLIS